MSAPFDASSRISYHPFVSRLDKMLRSTQERTSSLIHKPVPSSALFHRPLLFHDRLQQPPS